uniref:Secreted protein n=1 Tax=Globodera pallida TaxID=36090 RepID=A0A183BTF0_GLOPA
MVIFLVEMGGWVSNWTVKLVLIQAGATALTQCCEYRKSVGRLGAALWAPPFGRCCLGAGDVWAPLFGRRTFGRQ